ncbi:hypothetical protein EBQ93_04315 [bacterium]|nr:hypothetical protein [bacterium]
MRSNIFVFMLTLCMIHSHMYPAMGRAAGAVGRMGTFAAGAMRGDGLPLWRSAAGNASAFNAAMFGLHSHRGHDVMARFPDVYNPALARPGAPVRPIFSGGAQGEGAVFPVDVEGDRSGVEPQTSRARDARQERRIRLQQAQELGAGRSHAWDEAMDESAKADRARRRQEAVDGKKAENSKPEHSQKETQSGSIFDRARTTAQQDRIARMSQAELDREMADLFGFPQGLGRDVDRSSEPRGDLVADTDGVLYEPGEPGYEEALAQLEDRAAQVSLPPLSEEELAEWEVLHPSDIESSELSGQLPGQVIDAEFEEVFPEDVEALQPFESGEAQEFLSDLGMRGQITDGTASSPEEIERMPVPGAHEIVPDRFEVAQQQASEIESAQKEQGIRFTVPDEQPLAPVQAEVLPRPVRPGTATAQQQVPDMSRVGEGTRTAVVVEDFVPQDVGPAIPVEPVDRSILISQNTRAPARRVDRQPQTSTQLVPQQTQSSAVSIRPEPSVPSVIPQRPVDVVSHVQPGTIVPQQQVPQLSGTVIDVEGREVLRLRDGIQNGLGRTDVVVPSVQDTRTPARRFDRQPQTSTQLVPQPTQSSAVSIRPEPIVPAVIPQRPVDVVSHVQPGSIVPQQQVPDMSRVGEGARTAVVVEDFVPEDVAPARPVEPVDRGILISQNTTAPARRVDRQPQTRGDIEQRPQNISDEQAQLIGQRRAQLEQEMREIEQRMDRIRARADEEAAADQEALARARREAEEQLQEGRRAAERNRQVQDDLEQNRLAVQAAARREAERAAQLEEDAARQGLRIERERLARQAEEEAEESAAQQRRLMLQEAEEATARRAEEEAAVERRAAEQAEREAAARRAEEKTVARAERERLVRQAEEEAAVARRAAEQAEQEAALRQAEEEAIARRRAVAREVEEAIEPGLVRRRIHELETRLGGRTSGRRNGSVRRRAQNEPVRPNRAQRNRTQERPARPHIPGRVIDAEYRVIDTRPARVPRRQIRPRMRPEIRPIVRPIVHPIAGMPGILPQVVPHGPDTNIFPVIPAYPDVPVVPFVRPVPVPGVDITPSVPTTPVLPTESSSKKDNQRTASEQPVTPQAPVFDTKAPRLFTDDYQEPENIADWYDATPAQPVEDIDDFEMPVDNQMPYDEYPFEEYVSPRPNTSNEEPHYVVEPFQKFTNIEFPEKEKKEKDPYFVGMQSAQEDPVQRTGIVKKPTPPKKIKREHVVILKDPETEYEDYYTGVRVLQWGASSLLLMIILYIVRRYFWS